MTYIDRLFDEDSTYEEELQDDLEDTGTLVVITGASKSGHIVLSAVGERVAAVNFVDEDNVRGVGQHYSVRRGNMRIFFYGIGRFYQRRRDELTELREEDTFLGFIDRRARECRNFDGAPVYLLEEALQKDFDAIVVTNASFGEIAKSLHTCGVPHAKILSYGVYLAKKKGAARQEFGTFGDCSGMRILMATIDLNYDGGTLALVHAAEAMSARGDRVTIAAPAANEKLLKEVLRLPVKVCLMPGLRYLKREQMDWMHAYDACLVNVYPNGAFAIEASQCVPTLWWMHEASNRFCSIYRDIQQEFPELLREENFSRLRIAAVSEQAKANFEHYYPGRVDAIMPYCLPDSGQDGIDEPQERVTFAIIGGVCRLKGQDVFLRAVALLPEQLKEKAAFVLIGVSDGKDAFSAAVRAAAEKEPSVKLLGVLNRAEMRKAYRQIDVVVCASREECLPTTMAEGMMYRKLCIATDAAGMNGMIQSGKNGLIVPVEDAEALASRMRHIIERPREYEAMRCAARHTYEAYFTPEKFSERLIEELGKTVECWGKKA